MWQVLHTSLNRYFLECTKMPQAVENSIFFIFADTNMSVRPHKYSEKSMSDSNFDTCSHASADFPTRFLLFWALPLFYVPLQLFSCASVRQGTVDHVFWEECRESKELIILFMNFLHVRENWSSAGVGRSQTNDIMSRRWRDIIKSFTHLVKYLHFFHDFLFQKSFP